MPENVIAELGSKSGPSQLDGGLLGLMSSTILGEKRRADRHLESMVREMIQLVDESIADDQRRRVPLVAQWAIVAGFLMAVFAGLVFTPAAEIVDLSFLGEFGKVLLWLVASVAIVASSWVVLAASGGKARVAAIATAIFLVVALVLGFAPLIRDSDFVSSLFGSSAGLYVLWLATIAVAITGVTARLVVPRQVGEWRSALSRFIGIATVAFLASWLVVIASQADSFLQTESRYLEELAEQGNVGTTELAQVTARLGDCEQSPPEPGTLEALGCWFDRHTDRVEHISDATRQRLLISGLVLGGFMFVAGIGVVSILWVRIEFRNRDRGIRFNFAADEAIRASRARRRLKFFMTQWLGTASALSRIVWRPLGEVTEVGHRDAAAMQADAELLKLQVAELRLTQHGDEILLARLRSLMVRPGWLTDQYRKAATTYVADDPQVLAADLPFEERPRPETCPSTPAIEDVLEGTAEGLRWGFVKSLYNGSLDGALQEKLSEYSPSEIYRILLDSEQAASVHEFADDVHSPKTGSSAQEFFEDVLPNIKPSLPIGIVDQAFVANDQRVQMTPFLCWPEELLPGLEIDCERLESINAAEVAGAVITAVRCDVSGSFSLSDLEVLDPEIDNPEPPKPPPGPDRYPEPSEPPTAPGL